MKIHSGPIYYSSSPSENGLTIIGLISEGHTFRVFKAQSGTKFVILKAPVSADTMSIEILRREYELSRSLSHPCIVNTIGFENDSPVGPAIVMEFIEGLTLDEFVAHGPSISQRKGVLKDILDGVDYLHHRGVLHNDLKPDNIIINSNGAAHIIDFGLSGSDDSVYKGCIGGSDGYTAPEIIRGETNAGAASDIYSIGLLIGLLFGGRKYRSIASKCSRDESAKRYQTIEELRRSVHRYNVSPWFVASAGAIILIFALSLTPTFQKMMNDSEVYSLEDKFEEELAPRFNDAIERMQRQPYQEFAAIIEDDYLRYCIHFLDSLETRYPMSDTGEIAPEIFAICAVSRRHQEYTDSIKMSLPSIKALPANEQKALMKLVNSGTIPD